MRSPLTKRKCRHCKVVFAPNPRSAGRQHYCSKPECRRASKAASQRRWLKQPANRNYFKGPTHVERVRQWRKAHPCPSRKPKAAELLDNLDICDHL